MNDCNFGFMFFRLKPQVIIYNVKLYIPGKRANLKDVLLKRALRIIIIGDFSVFLKFKRSPTKFKAVLPL